MLTILATTLSLVSIAPAEATVIFRDDFDAAELDRSAWQIADWPLGRSRFVDGVAVNDGIATLRFQTYAPQNPGETMLGAELYSADEFAPPPGGVLEIEARVRVNDAAPGLVTSIFTYSVEQVDGAQVSDEIDFEFLSALNHDSDAGVITCTSWDNWHEGKSTHDDETVKSSKTIIAPEIDLAAFNVYVIRWSADRVAWFVNGALVRETGEVVPNTPSAIRFNFWAAGPGWTEAHDADLQPVDHADDNRTFTYDIDHVEVRTLERSPAE